MGDSLVKGTNMTHDEMENFVGLFHLDSLTPGEQIHANEQLSAIATPPPDNLVLWRYMPFCRFESILQDKALFFSRVDKFDDDYEGALTQYHKLVIRARLKSNFESLSKLLQTYRTARSQVLASCWYAGTAESIQMWDRFSGCDRRKGILLKSSYGSMRRCLPEENYWVQGRMMLYVDFDRAFIMPKDLFEMCSLKRREFKDEEEVRFFTLWPDKQEGPPRWEKVVPGSETSLDPGFLMPVRIDRLIEEVRVSPYAEPRFLDLVESVVRDHRLAVPVRGSSISSLPA